MGNDAVEKGKTDNIEKTVKDMGKANTIDLGAIEEGKSECKEPEGSRRLLPGFI